jgi:hypothetical protein
MTLLLLIVGVFLILSIIGNRNYQLQLQEEQSLLQAKYGHHTNIVQMISTTNTQFPSLQNVQVFLSNGKEVAYTYNPNTKQFYPPAH